MITREEEVSWAYLLDPCFQFENTAGKPLTGGYIEVYLHGTRNRYYCASDFNGTLHPFQIKLDSIGSNIVLADPSNSYDVYVYNRYGNLVMSRYNVSPGHTGSGAYDRYDELENLIVSAVTGLQGEIDDIDEALEGKKDKQEVVSLTFTNTQTVSSIVQNENGELEITYQEIALPEQVPNIDIVSLASTISVSSVYDPETNIKTFNIDISDVGALEYGRYTAEPFNAYATLVKNKGNISLEDGMLKLRKGNSYHVTVRGEYVSTDLDNTVQAIEYVEQVSNTRIKVDVDNTVVEPQHFELSYDIFKLGHDTDYQVGFNQDTGIIENLVLEIHSLSNVSVVNGSGGEQVQADWTEEDPDEPSYIQNKPDIKDLVEGTNIHFREEEDAIYIDAVVTAIPTVTGFATHEEVYESSVTAVQLATAQIPDSEEVEFEEIDLSDYALASAIPTVTGFATHSEVYSAAVTAIDFVTAIIPEAQVQSDWIEEDNTDPAYILNKPAEKVLLEGDNIRIRETNEGVYIDALVTAIPSVTGFTTDADVYNATVTAVQLATSLIPEEQVQSDWNVTAIDNPAYIQNKPDITPLIEGDNIHFTETADGIMISASMPTASGTVTDVEVYNATVTAVQLATAQIPDVSDFVTEDQVTALLPDTEDVQFEEIDLSDYALASAIPDVTNLASKAEVYNSVVTGVQLATAQIPDVSSFATKTQVYNATVTAIDTVTSMIPESQVQSDWAVTSVDNPAYIKNKPEILENIPLRAGEGIGISMDNDEVIVAVTAQYLTEIPSTYATDTEVYNATVTGVQLATAQIPDVSDMATQTWVGNQGYLTSIPSTYATDVEVYNATVTAVQLATAQIPDVSSFATDTEIYNATVTAVNIATGQIPDSEDVTFEEIDLSVYALASAIPSVTGFTTATEVYNATVTAVQLATGQIPDVSDMATQTWVGEQGFITSIPSNYATDTEVYNATVTGVQLATAQIPDSEDVTFEEVDLSDYALATAIPDVSNLTTQADVYNATVTAVQLATAQIPDISDMATQTWVGNQGFLTSIPSTYATDTEVNNAVVTGIQAATGWTGAQNYLTSVPNTYATKTYVDNSVTGFQTKLRDINDIQVVASLPANPTSSTLYLIPEA